MSNVTKKSEEEPLAASEKHAASVAGGGVLRVDAAVRASVAADEGYGAAR